MAGKRKTKIPKREAALGPSKWRLQHGGFSEPIRDADPETGVPVAHRRAVDTLGLMLTNGTISPEMHDAAVAFRTTFRTAALDDLQPMALDRISGGPGDGMSERNLHARRKVAAAMVALGGFSSAAGSIVWHVVGLEASVREWAQRQGWGGRPVGAPQAQGMLVAALSVLAGHYGPTPRRQAA